MLSMGSTGTPERSWSYARTDMWGPWRLWTVLASSTHTSHCSCYRCSAVHRSIDREPVFFWITYNTPNTPLRIHVVQPRTPLYGVRMIAPSVS